MANSRDNNNRSGRLSKGKTQTPSLATRMGKSSLESYKKNGPASREPSSESERLQAIAGGGDSKVARRGVKTSQRMPAQGGDKQTHSNRSSIRGMGLGAKLSITIALVSVGITICVGGLIASRTSDFIKEEIFKSGMIGVHDLAALGRAMLLSNYDGMEHDIRDLKAKIEPKVKHSRLSDLLINRIANLEMPIVDGYVSLSEVEFNGKTHQDESKLFSIADESRGKNINISTDKNEPPIRKSDTTPMVAIRKATLTKNENGVNREQEIYEFILDLNIKALPLYNEAPVRMGGYRPRSGSARLFLSTEKITEAKNSVYRLTGIILGGSIIISIVIAYVLSMSITRPILQLVKDMSSVSKGDFNHRTVAHSTDEVGYLSTTFNNLTQSLKAARETELEKEKLEHDLSVGREIQQTLLPKTLYKIPNYDLDAFYMSAKEVGGDYYDLIPVDKTKLGVIVADVSGKGIQGAMIMTIMRTVMNIAAVGNLSCTNCLGRTNRFLSDRIKRGMFVTAFYTILDCKNNSIKFASAGHNPMVFYRAATNSIELLNPTGIALGFDKGPLFDRTIKEGETTLNPGDRFVLYTDGVVEAMNENHEEFSDQRFHKFVLQNAQLDSKAFVHKLVAELKKHQGNAPQHDDITIVTFRRT